MTNWYCIEFKVSGPAADIARFCKAVRRYDHGVEAAFDFNRLVPIPMQLCKTIADFGTAYEVYYGDAESVLGYPWIKNRGIDTVEKLRDHFNTDPKNRAIADQQKANIENHGVPTWFEWCLEYWGAWNACNSEAIHKKDGSLYIYFDTAWSFPFPIFEKLAAEFRTLDFVGWAEEPNTEIYLTFKGRDGKFTWQYDDEARQAAAAALEEQEESVQVTV